ECNALVKIGKIKHKYPLCWRSHHPIVWLARRGWFYKLDRLDNKAIDAAESVEYFFEQPKNRFLGIIKERHPWCISRERIWGCPLPVWSCEDCGEKNWFFSRQEIVESADKLPDGPDFELHRPWIDNITVKCKKCSSVKTKREEYVLDTWHNSGSAPYSSLTNEEYEKEIPAPFFTEGIDQTRGWAYTLLIENVILNNSATPPYKSFLFQGHVLDEKGGKMSKSKGNVLEGAELLEKYPVDLIRFYFMWKASPIEPLSFSTEELMSRPYQVINTLFNLHLYFKQNSQYDNFDNTNTLEWAKSNNSLTSPDIWLLSKLQKLIRKITEKNQTCKFHEGAKAMDDFIINNLSQIYIPITRGELWDESDEKKNRRLAIYAVLNEVLKT
ncbi:MAG: class I tRNA ligase family protein, partial [Nitrosopumilus sp.]|nr:class I tRNA ligase family protein [Nitrosopumilus sp.]